MALLPELIDEILTYLQDDERTLKNCSLIAKSWAYPSQKLLYAQVYLTPENDRMGREDVSSRSEELLQHVRTLHCRGFHPLYSFLGDYFGSLHRLEHLTLCGLIHIETGITNLFLAFQTTLSSLSLGSLLITWDAIINVVDYFPNLRDFLLGQSTFVGDCQEVPPLSRPPRGRLSLFTLSSDDMFTVSRGLSASELRYNELEIIDIYDRISSRAIMPIISSCGKTLTRLVLDRYDSSCDPTLEDCSELRELVFITSWQISKEPALIASITSMNIQKIVFVLLDCGVEWSYALWWSLDIALSNLVDRLRASGYDHTLELEFRLQFAEIDPEDDLDAIFPRFREKGRVTISEKTSRRIIYCSDG